MNLVRFIEYLRSHLKVVVWTCYGALGLLVVLDAVPFLVNKKHAHTTVEHFTGFWAGFGFVACVAIILLSKWFGHAGIMQREDYYEEKSSDREGGAS